MRFPQRPALFALGFLAALPAGADLILENTAKLVYFESLEASDTAADLGRFASMLLSLRLEPERLLHVVRSAEPPCRPGGGAQVGQQVTAAVAQAGSAAAPPAKYFAVKGSLVRLQSEYSLSYEVRAIDHCQPATLAKGTQRFSAADSLAALNALADEIASKLTDAASDKTSVQVSAADDRLRSRLELAFGESEMFRTVSSGGAYRVAALRTSGGIRFDIAGPGRVTDTVTVPAGNKKYAVGSFADIEACDRAVRNTEDIEARRRAGITGPIDRWPIADLVSKAREVACANAACNADPRAVRALLDGRPGLPPEGSLLLGDALMALDQPASAALNYERALPHLKGEPRRAASIKAATAFESGGQQQRARELWISLAAEERSSGGLTPETAIRLSRVAAGNRQAWTILLEAAAGKDAERKVSSDWNTLLQRNSMRSADLQAACADSGERGVRVLEAQCLRALAFELHTGGDEGAAAGRYREAIRRLDGSPDWAQPLAAQYAFELANSLNRNNQRAEAIAAARQALALRTRIFGAEHETTGESLFQLGQLLCWDKRFEDSRAYLERALAIRSRSQSGPRERGITEQFLAYVLGQLGKPRDAESHFKTAIAALEEADDSAQLASALGDFAGMLSGAGRFGDAEKQYGRQLEIYSQKQFGNDRTAGAMLSLAIVLANEGKFEEATAKAREGVRLQEQSDNPAAARFYNGLGTVLLYSGEYSAALDQAAKALQLRLKEAAGPVLAAVEYYELALCQEYLGRYEESEKNYRQGLDADTRAYGRDSSDAAYTELRMANVLTLTGRYREASEALAHAVPIVKKTNPAPSLRHTIADGLLAELLASTGKMDEALLLARKALSVRESARADSEWRQCVYLLRVGRILVAQHREPEAVPYLRRVIEIWERFKVPEHPDIATAEWGLGVAEGAAGRFDKMETRCRRALAIATKAGAPSPIDASAAHACLAEAAAHSAQFATAVREQSEAVETFLRACPRAHPRSAQLIERYAELLEASGERSSAEGQRERAKQIRARMESL